MPLALGGVGISLRDLTMLYVAIPTGGEVRDAALPRRRAGRRNPSPLRQTVAAWYLFDVLKGANLPDGWSMGQGIERARDIAFKTGTSYGYRDAWAIGFSQRYTVGIWVGRADGSTRPGHIGRNDAAPLAAESLRPLAQRRARALAAARRRLSRAERRSNSPRGLQRFRRSPATRGRPEARTAAAHLLPAERRDGLARQSEEPQALPLKAQGGTRAAALGDQRPAARRPVGSGTDSWWTPDGEGFARITVVDADGRSDTSQIRLKAEN